MGAQNKGIIHLKDSTYKLQKRAPNQQQHPWRVRVISTNRRHLNIERRLPISAMKLDVGVEKDAGKANLNKIKMPGQASRKTYPLGVIIQWTGPALLILKQ
jgi:hypothetical protein